MDEIGSGTRELFQDTLREAEVDAEVLSWTMTVNRCSYYSDNPDSDVWEDVWKPLWKVELTLGGPVEIDDYWTNSLIQPELTDDSYSMRDGITEASDTGCMVILEFDTEDQCRSAQEEIERVYPSLVTEHMREPRLSVHTEQVPQGYFQMIVELGKVRAAFFEEGAEPAIAIREIGRSHGGTFHFWSRI